MSVGVEELQLEAVIGFTGTVKNGFILHPDDQHVIYPLGCSIVVKHLKNGTQRFLQKDGHDKAVTAMALSGSGKYLASGQISIQGFQAPVLVWDLETMSVVKRLVLHKGKIQSICFSPNEKYLATLGGPDDNKIILWDLETSDPVCGTQAANEPAQVVKFLSKDNLRIMSAGDRNIRVWDVDLPNRKLRPTDIQLGAMKRLVSSLFIDANDEYAYCGTQSGDILKIRLSNKVFQDSGPKKKPFSLGVQCMFQLKNGDLIIAAGDGTVACVQTGTFKVLRSIQVAGTITSIALNAAGDHFFVGTAQSNVYLVAVNTFEHELRSTCHYAPINDVIFPRGYSELFATCSSNDIRVWHARTRNELLRIQVPNLECLCTCFSPDGKSIISGWSDGKIRAFRPQSGTLIYTINDAHAQGVTALVVSNDCSRLLSGGGNGVIRMWNIAKSTQTMIASLKEHKGAVTYLQIKNDDTEAVSSSTDGSCITWDLQRFVRNACFFASSQFSVALYHPDESQLLTAGTDRKVTVWDVVDGSAIRITDASPSAEVNSLAISSDGSAFVSAGGDKIVKVWNYEEGRAYFFGFGHSGTIRRVAISPDQKSIVSVGTEGSVFIWKMPKVPSTLHVPIPSSKK
jgi:WD40 repeat protein